MSDDIAKESTCDVCPLCRVSVPLRPPEMLFIFFFSFKHPKFNLKQKLLDYNHNKITHKIFYNFKLTYILQCCNFLKLNKDVDHPGI